MTAALFRCIMGEKCGGAFMKLGMWILMLVCNLLIREDVTARIFERFCVGK